MPGLSGSDLIFYGFLLILGLLTFGYTQLKRLGGPEPDYLGDDFDTSDSDDSDGGGDDD